MRYELLRVRRDGPVEYVTLNRPEVRNAFNEHLIAELTRWADDVAGRRDVRAVVLDGAGPMFSAGADLSWMAKMAGYTHEENVRDARAAAVMFGRLNTIPVALIGRIHGAALGGGAGLVAVCDIAVADEATIFGFTEVKLGILPATISPFVLARIGQSAARELFLTGRRFGAQHASAIGLVQEAVSAERLDATVAEYVREILSAGPEAVAAAKALIRDVALTPPADVVEMTAETLAARRASAEGREGIRAFLDRRKPSWSGG